MNCKLEKFSAYALASKPSSSFSSTSSVASATSSGTSRSGGSRLLFGEIDTSSERCTRLFPHPLCKVSALTQVHKQLPKATHLFAISFSATAASSSSSGSKTSAERPCSPSCQTEILRIYDWLAMTSVCEQRRRCSPTSALPSRRPRLQGHRS